MKQILLLPLLLITIACFAQPHGHPFFPNDPLAAEMYNDYFHDHDKKKKPMIAFHKKWKKKYPISIEEGEYYYNNSYHTINKLKAEVNGNHYSYHKDLYFSDPYICFSLESDAHIKFLGSSSVNTFLDQLQQNSDQLNFSFWIEGDDYNKRSIFIRSEESGNRVGYTSFVFLKLECVDNKITKVFNLPITSDFYENLMLRRDQKNKIWSTKAVDWRYLNQQELAENQKLKTAVAALDSLTTPSPYSDNEQSPLAKQSKFHIYKEGVTLQENVKGKQGVHLVHYGNFVYEGPLSDGLPSGKGQLLFFNKKIDDVWYTFKDYKLRYSKEIKATHEGVFFAGKTYESTLLEVQNDGSFFAHSALFQPLEKLTLPGFLKFAPGTNLSTFQFKAQETIILYAEKEVSTPPQYELQFTDASLQTLTGTYDSGSRIKILGLEITKDKGVTCKERKGYKVIEDGERLLSMTHRSSTPCACNIGAGEIYGKNIEKVIYDLNTKKPKYKSIGAFTTLKQGTWVMIGQHKKYQYENDQWVTNGTSTYAKATKFGKEEKEYVYNVNGDSDIGYIQSLRYHQDQLQLFKESKSEATVSLEHLNLFREKYGYDSGNTYGEQVVTKIAFNGSLRDYYQVSQRSGEYCLIFTNLGETKNVQIRVRNSDDQILGSETITLAQGVQNELFTIDLSEEDIYYEFFSEDKEGATNFDDVYVLTGYKHVYMRTAAADIARAAQRERARNAEAIAHTKKTTPVKKKSWLQKELDRSATYQVLVIKNDGFSDCYVRYIVTGGHAVYGGGISATVPANGKVEVSFTASTSNVKLDTSCIGVSAYWK